MQILGGLFVLVLIASAMVLGQQWQTIRADIQSAEITVAGFQSLIEVLYGYRLDHPTQWPGNANDLSSYLPTNAIHSSTSLGSNGEGLPYSLSVVGSNVQLRTQLTKDHVSQRVVQALGSRATRTTSANGYFVTVSVPPPGGVNLLRSSLLVDGSNKLDRPLWFRSNRVVNASCSGNGIATDSTGKVLTCQSGRWQRL